MVGSFDWDALRERDSGVVTLAPSATAAVVEEEEGYGLVGAGDGFLALWYVSNLSLIDLPSQPMCAMVRFRLGPRPTPDDAGGRHARHGGSYSRLPQLALWRRFGAQARSRPR